MAIQFNDNITCHSKAQVVLARGIVENWKQPVYFNFDTAMSKEILFQIIISLEQAGIHVVSITSDLGGENRRLWNILKISPDQPWIVNPYDPNRRIYFFADMPHLLKLIRNHIIDDGFETDDGAVIDKSVMEAIVHTNCNELKLCPDLTQSLLDVTGPERMRVRPAAKLLSRHSAMIAKQIYSDTMEIGNFLQLINDGFDVFNSRCHINATNPLLCAFGVNLDQQTAILTNLKRCMESGRFYQSNKCVDQPRKMRLSLLPCQIGYLVSIESLIQLFNYLQSEYNLEYLMSCRVTQDCLESFFSRIRGYGGPNTNPTPSEFRYRFRLILLGGSVRPPKDSNSLEYCGSSYVSADILDKNNINAFVNRDENNFNPEDLNLSSDIQQNLQTYKYTDELDYLAGYIAFRLKRKYPLLPHYGFPTSNSHNIDLTQISWIHMLSRGGLLIPNPTLREATLKCNLVFETMIKEIQDIPNLHNNMYKSIIHEFPDILKEIVEEFIKVRVKIRIKHLNLDRKQIMSAKKLKSVLNSHCCAK